MQQKNSQFDDRSATRFESLSTPFVAPMPTESALRLQPSVARAIAGPASRIADLTCMSAALIYLALWAGGGSPGISSNVLDFLSMRISIGHFAVLAVCLLLWHTVFSYCGLYTWRHVQSMKGLPGRVALATFLSSLIAGRTISTVWHHGHFVREMLLFWVIAGTGVMLSRIAIGLFRRYVQPRFRKSRYAVIVGKRARAGRIAEELKAHPKWDYKILGRVDSVVSQSKTPADCLGAIGDIEDILLKQVVDEVIVALPAKSDYAAIEHTISVCERVGVQVQYRDDLFFDASRRGRCYRESYDSRKVILKMVEHDYRHRIKRGIDIVGALFGLILCAPVFLVVAILIKSTSPGPVFFLQQRYGLGRRIFWIYKFRTMVVNAEAAQASLEHLNENSGPVFKIFKDPRVTKVGAFLRRTSIDEIPQLINILKGEMSFVGPRPLNLRDVGLFSEAWLMRRFSVKPGLTCLWQIGGRSNVSFDRWIELDLQYIDNWSLELDMKILARTVPVVLRETGAA